MQNAYQLRSPIAQRAIQPFGTIPTPSMLDTSLAHQNLPFPQTPQGFAVHAMSTSHSPSSNNSECLRKASEERELPSRDVTDHNLDEAYVQFALYCNPPIPKNAETSELKRRFRSPPRSDDKVFSTFKLYELISRLEHKDIKTWSQLVIELGVELPDTSKNQSTQKVQQYAVRLKVS